MAAQDQSLPQLTEENLQILRSPPFVQIEGVVNIRDAGGRPSLISPDKEVRRGYLYRSGEPSRITDKGKSQLQQLGLKMVFDLRSDTEIQGYKAAPLHVDGIDFMRAPVSRTESYDPVGLALRMHSFQTDPLSAFIILYMEIIDQGGEALEKILVHLRDKPEDPCLIHCTAGKDRAGSFTALVLLLLGVPDEEIVKDYALTTVGLAPALPMLIARFQAQQVFRDNWEGALNMASSKPETMIALLKTFREKYGTVENYVKTCTSLDDEGIAKIRNNLLVPKF